MVSRMSDQPDMLSHAIALARTLGPVMPTYSIVEPYVCSCAAGAECNAPGRHTIVRWSSATTREKAIRSLWRRYPDAGIAILCTELVIVDIDGPAGRESLREWQREHGELPRTVTAITARGRHYYFRVPPDAGLRSRSHVMPGVDVKVGKAMILAPPTKHKSGKPYRWLRSPLDHEIADAPESLFNLLVPAHRAATAATRMGTSKSKLRKGPDTSRSARDMYAIVELFAEGGNECDAVDWLDAHSEKYQQKQKQNPEWAASYAWATIKAASRIHIATIVSAGLEILPVSHGRARLARIRLALRMPGGAVISTRIVVPSDGYPDSRVFDAVFPDGMPEKLLSGARVARELTGRRLLVCIDSHDRITWMRAMDREEVAA